jgi:phosphoribosyl-ATP pyrophosphohydrolase
MHTPEQKGANRMYKAIIRTMARRGSRRKHAGAILKHAQPRRFLRSALLGALLGTAALQAGAQMKPDAACEQQARHAEKLAAARDRGLAERQAVEAVLADEASANRQELDEAAQLLFHRFQRMQPEQAAFEFMASCLDEAQ